MFPTNQNHSAVFPKIHLPTTADPSCVAVLATSALPVRFHHFWHNYRWPQTDGPSTTILGGNIELQRENVFWKGWWLKQNEIIKGKEIVLPKEVSRASNTVLSQARLETENTYNQGSNKLSPQFTSLKKTSTHPRQMAHLLSSTLAKLLGKQITNLRTIQKQHI